MAKKMPCAVQAAHVPVGLMYDERATRVFGTPEQLEATYQKHRGPDIHENYLEQMEQVFVRVRDVCKTPMWVRLQEEIVALTDTAELAIEVTHEFIALHVISIRPCFERNSMLVIVVYQLLRLAVLYQKSKVVVTLCGPKTVDVLRSKFDDLDVMEVRYTATEGTCCVFADMRRVRVRVNARALGIEHRVGTRADGLLQLKREAFPTAQQLNDAKYVDDVFSLRGREQNPFVYERLASDEEDSSEEESSEMMKELRNIFAAQAKVS